MSPAPFPDFRWVFRALPVVAIAALVGGAIGGFSVFAIDLATAPTRHDDQTAQTKTGGPPKVSENMAAPNVDVSAHAPAAGTSAPPPAQGSFAPHQQASGPEEPSAPASAQAPQIAVTPPLPEPQKVWPDALSRRHQEAQSTSNAATAEPASATAALAPEKPVAHEQAAPERSAATAAPAAEKPVVREQVAPERSAATAAPARAKPVAHEQAPPERSAATPGVATKPAPAKPHVVSKRRARAMENAAAESPRNRRSVYDYYGREDRRVTSDTDADEARDGYARPRRELGQNGHGKNAAPPVEESEDRPVMRRVQRSDMDDDDDDVPPQPAPPPLFFGLFGFGDR